MKAVRKYLWKYLYMVLFVSVIAGNAMLVKPVSVVVPIVESVHNSAVCLLVW